MLMIDDKTFEVKNETIKVCELTNNGIKGYDINIHLDFSLNGENGYLNLDVGYEMENNIKKFTNREYRGIPFDNDGTFIYFEVYDTFKFLDTEIESIINMKIGDISNDKIHASFEVNDELIKIKYEGDLNL